MRRREFITLLGGGAVSWPLAVGAQQPTLPRRLGILMGLPESDPEVKTWLAAFLDGLRGAGWIQSRNIKIEYQWSKTVDTIDADAARLVNTAPDVILARGSTTLEALRQKTNTVPIVFVGVSDPVRQGVVTSLAHPGGNITGFANHEYSIPTKLLEILKDIEPKLSRVLVIHDPGHPLAPLYLRTMETSAPSLNLRLNQIGVRNAAEIESAVTLFAQEPNGALVVMADRVTNFHRDLVINLAARYRLPAIYQSRYFAAAGGLISYGSYLIDQFQRAALYVDRILKGKNPAELPIEQPTKFELVVNVKTAKMLGLDVPPTLLARADEVIE